MVDAWPSNLPQAFQINGFTESEGDGLIEYAPDIGPSIVRLGTSAVMRPMVGNMMVSDVQLSSFRTFFETTILRGSLPFSFPDQTRAGTLLVKFTKQNPPGWVCLGGPTYQLNLALMVMP